MNWFYGIMNTVLWMDGPQGKLLTWMYEQPCVANDNVETSDAS